MIRASKGKGQKHGWKGFKREETKKWSHSFRQHLKDPGTGKKLLGCAAPKDSKNECTFQIKFLNCFLCVLLLKENCPLVTFI